MAAEGGDIVRFTYTAEAEGEDIPDDVTHLFVDVKTIPARAFDEHILVSLKLFATMKSKRLKKAHSSNDLP